MTIMTKTAARLEVLSAEDAYETLKALENVSEIGLCGVHIAFGTHTLKGNIQLIIPAAGDALLCYPFESHTEFLYKKE